MSHFPKSQIKTKIYLNRILTSLSFDESMLDILPDDVIKQILLPLPYETIKNFCLINPERCESDVFCSDKLDFDFEIKSPYIPKKWKKFF